MYAWIWRHLPFGLPGKISGSLLLVGGALSLLWFVIFPLASPWIEDFLLPFDQSTLEGDWDPGGGDPGSGEPGSDDPGLVEDEPDDPHDIPYDTDG